jgi:ubiquinone/menaquinone biosynthesis C-methylase UbiE
MAHLPSITQCRRALLLGEGPGRFLPLVLKQFPNALITCIDSSALMLALARVGIQEADRGRVDFVEADIWAWQPAAAQFDFIATNFFLDCLSEDELVHVLPRIANVATRDANWLVADFNVPQRGFVRWRAAFIIGALYRFFRFTTGLSARKLDSPEPLLERVGFRLHRRVEIDHGLLRSDWWKRRSGSE